MMDDIPPVTPPFTPPPAPYCYSNSKCSLPPTPCDSTMSCISGLPSTPKSIPTLNLDLSWHSEIQKEQQESRTSHARYSWLEVTNGKSAPTLVSPLRPRPLFSCDQKSARIHLHRLLSPSYKCDNTTETRKNDNAGGSLWSWLLSACTAKKEQEQPNKVKQLYLARKKERKN